jgi:hypothetical protein
VIRQAIREVAVQIKYTSHAAKGKHVVNTPGSHHQRQPRVFGCTERARERIEELRRDHPEATLVEIRR